MVHIASRAQGNTVDKLKLSALQVKILMNTCMATSNETLVSRPPPAPYWGARASFVLLTLWLYRRPGVYSQDWCHVTKFCHRNTPKEAVLLSVASFFVTNAMLLDNVSVYDTECCQTVIPWMILQSDDDRLTIATFFERVSSDRQWTRSRDSVFVCCLY